MGHNRLNFYYTNDKDEQYMVPCEVSKDGKTLIPGEQIRIGESFLDWQIKTAFDLMFPSGNWKEFLEKMQHFKNLKEE